MNKLMELAERVEKATGPDRELDAAIWLAAVADDASLEMFRVGQERHGETEAQFRLSRMMDGCSYTASLDAAMTLVPEGCNWTLEPDAAWVRWMGREDVEEAQGHLIGRDGKCTALALCAAALRARAGEE